MKRRILVAAILTAGLAGCASQPPMVSDPNFAAVLPEDPASNAPGRSNGAIFQPGMMDNMVADARPYRVGDILTVMLTERTQASKSASTSTGKTQETAITAPDVFGLNTPYWEPLRNRFNASLQGERSFDGSGNSSQQNSLDGQITVTVARVLPNGNLIVRGEKFLGINQGTEFVRVSGIVRPQDIGSDNTIASTRIADARISYGGQGIINDANNMGWLARFFNSPIFPF
ncbi:MAG: flagellar basal body L-ring protein FlgH [Halothiobacillaceae bacterium]